MVSTSIFSLCFSYSFHAHSSVSFLVLLSHPTEVHQYQTASNVSAITLTRLVPCPYLLSSKQLNSIQRTRTWIATVIHSFSYLMVCGEAGRYLACWACCSKEPHWTSDISSTFSYVCGSLEGSVSVWIGSVSLSCGCVFSPCLHGDHPSLSIYAPVFPEEDSHSQTLIGSILVIILTLVTIERSY